MSRFGKFPAFLVLLASAALVAAIFGALMNQLSFSVGPTYFTAVKFPQFGIAEGTAPRWGAAVVGAQAAWWMGALVGLPAFLIGLLRVPRTASYLAAGLGAIGLVICVATFAALAGLVVGLAADTTGLLDAWISVPDGPTRSDFLRAGLMHDAAYLGGIVGAIVALTPMRHARRIDLARAQVA